MNVAKKSKQKKRPVSKMNQLKKEPTVQSNTDTTSSESDSDDADVIQKPKRKRPSDYIAKKDRPDNLKSDRRINELSLDEAIEICKLSAKRAKLETTS